MVEQSIAARALKGEISVIIIRLEKGKENDNKRKITGKKIPARKRKELNNSGV